MSGEQTVVEVRRKLAYRPEHVVITQAQRGRPAFVSIFLFSNGVSLKSFLVCVSTSKAGPFSL